MKSVDWKVQSRQISEHEFSQFASLRDFHVYHIIVVKIEFGF